MKLRRYGADFQYSKTSSCPTALAIRCSARYCSTSPGVRGISEGEFAGLGHLLAVALEQMLESLELVEDHQVGLQPVQAGLCEDLPEVPDEAVSLPVQVPWHRGARPWHLLTEFRKPLPQVGSPF